MLRKVALLSDRAQQPARDSAYAKEGSRWCASLLFARRGGGLQLRSGRAGSSYFLAKHRTSKAPVAIGGNGFLGESPVGCLVRPSGPEVVLARMAGLFSLVLIGAAEWEGGRFPSDAPKPWKDFACNQPRDL